MPRAALAIQRLARASALAAVPLAAACLGACTTVPATPDGPPRKETAVAVTASNQLIRFNAGQPGRILSKTPSNGLPRGESVPGIDFCIAKGQLYAPLPTACSPTAPSPTWPATRTPARRLR